MLADPVTPPFSRRTALCDDKSPEKPRLAVPARRPVVIVMRRLAPNSCASWHRTDDSDSQLVLSQPLSPTAADTHNPESPKLAPCTVTLADPVAPLFTRLIALADEDSDENAIDTLPTRSPTVADTRRLLVLPRPFPHRTAVSDSHRVCSHALCPRRTAPLYPLSPRPSPYKVTLEEPVPAALALTWTLIESTSADTNSVAVPIRTPAVILDLYVKPVMLGARHLALVSETHSVDSHPVAPALDTSDKSINPIFKPEMVMLTDPVDAKLLRSSALAKGMSKE